MVPFAGYDMPVQYAAGVMKEHLHTRAAAGLFDVSHMGQISLKAKTGRIEDAALALETLVPVDVLGLADGRQRYAVFTNDEGGVLDDLMIARLGDRFFIVVNASRKDEDFAHLSSHLGSLCEIDRLEDRRCWRSRGRAPRVCSPNSGRMSPRCDSWMWWRPRSTTCPASSPAPAIAARTASRSRSPPTAPPMSPVACSTIPMSCRSASARAIRCGSKPASASTAMIWMSKPPLSKRRSNGRCRRCAAAAARAGGGFPGSAVILRQFEAGASRRRVGLKPDGKAPVRAHAALFADAQGGTPVGEVTSGSFGPSVEGPVAMGYVATEHAAPGTLLFAEVRGKYLPVTVAALPFISPTYKR